MRKITSWKGGRSERIYARMTREAKAKLLARVKHEGYKSLDDWLEAQAMAQPTPREPDVCNVTVAFSHTRVTQAVSLQGAYMSKVEMTEKAYIIVTDLQKVRHVQNLMRDIVPEINENIPKEEYRAVMSLLRKWEVSLQSAFECR